MTSRSHCCTQLSTNGCHLAQNLTWVQKKAQNLTDDLNLDQNNTHTHALLKISQNCRKTSKFTNNTTHRFKVKLNCLAYLKLKRAILSKLRRVLQLPLMQSEPFNLFVF